MKLFRISNHADLTGLGGERTDGRWHTAEPGKRIVYLADHVALSLLEVFVQFKIHSDVPESYQLMSLVVPDEQIETLDGREFGPDWQDDVARSRLAGDTWLAERGSLALRVPSVIVPFAWNSLLNPLHPAVAKLRPEVHGRYPFDPRLRKQA